MKDLVQCAVTFYGLQQWLEAGTAPLTIHYDEKDTLMFTRLERASNVSYLYSVPLDQNGHVSWQDGLMFCGVYDTQHSALYLTRSALHSIAKGQTRFAEESISSMAEEISSRINQRVEDIIANDRNNLTVQTITSWQAARELKDYLEDGAHREALDRFFGGNEPDGQFHSGYVLDRLPEAAFMAWLQDSEGFIQTEADQYIKVNQEKFLLQFLKNDALLKEYQTLVQNPDSPLHRVKAISEAIKSSGAKTVTVTVQKDGEELSFRTGTTPLRGRYNSYSTSHITAADRQEFERLFGPHTNYTAEDITRITYGKRTIYEAPSAQMEELSMCQGMGGMM